MARARSAGRKRRVGGEKADIHEDAAPVQKPDLIKGEGEGDVAEIEATQTGVPFEGHPLAPMGPFISAKGMESIIAHKYKGGDWTPLDRLLNVVWEGTLSLLPEWLAPNAITLLGLLCHVVYFALFVYLLLFTDISDPDSVLPRWAHGCAGVLVFAYSVLDAVDGKQARRTGSSSPLGQLFDHGADALASMVFLPFALAWAVGIAGSWQHSLLLVLSFLNLFCPQWEEAHTGCMRTAVGGMVGVSEAILVVCAVFATSACLGDLWWGQVLALAGGFPITPAALLLAVYTVATGSVLVSCTANGKAEETTCQAVPSAPHAHCTPPPPPRSGEQGGMGWHCGLPAGYGGAGSHSCAGAAWRWRVGVLPRLSPCPGAGAGTPH